jgi:4-amino-4-deoxy-L-arabinose transferase-like glycosyltransferase
MGLSPLFITRAWNASEDVLYIPILLIAFYFIARLLRSEAPIDFIKAGIAIGIAFMARSTVLFALIVFAPIALLYWKRTRLYHLSVFIIAFVVAIVPMLFINYIQYNKILISDHGGSRLWVANNDLIESSYGSISIDRIEENMIRRLGKAQLDSLRKLDHLKQEDYFRAQAFKYIRSSPWGFLKGAMKKIIYSVNPYYNAYEKQLGAIYNIRQLIYSSFHVLLIIVGLYGYTVGWRLEKKWNVVMIALYSSMLLLAAALWVQSRHSIAYDMVFYNGIALMIRKHAV